MTFRATLDSRLRVLIPASGRLPTGLWMHSACRSLPLLAANLIGELARMSVKLVPSVATEVDPPITAEAWTRFIHDLEATAHRGISDMIVMRPSDARRARLTFLALDSERKPILFVKLTRNPPNHLAIQMLHKLDQLEPLFWYPRSIGSGTLQDQSAVTWWYSIDEPMPQGPHWPARLTQAHRQQIADTISHLAEPPARNVVAIHGDFAPWNVRRIGRRRLAIIDWENAAWAPVAADEMWFELTSALIRGLSPEKIAKRTEEALLGTYSRNEMSAAAGFWIKRRSEKEPDEVMQDVRRSRQLRAFEDRVGSVLKRLMTGPEAA